MNAQELCRALRARDAALVIASGVAKLGCKLPSSVLSLAAAVVTTNAPQARVALHTLGARPTYFSVGVPSKRPPKPARNPAKVDRLTNARERTIGASPSLRNVRLNRSTPSGTLSAWALPTLNGTWAPRQVATAARRLSRWNRRLRIQIGTPSGNQEPQSVLHSARPASHQSTCRCWLLHLLLRWQR